MGKILIVLGLILVLLGLLFTFSPGFRLGRLPGDIVIRRGNWTFHFPLATSVLLSVLVTLALWLLSGFRK